CRCSGALTITELDAGLSNPTGKNRVGVGLRHKKVPVQIPVYTASSGVINHLISMVSKRRINARGARKFGGVSWETRLIRSLIVSNMRGRSVWPPDQGSDMGEATIVHHGKIGFKIAICIDG